MCVSQRAQGGSRWRAARGHALISLFAAVCLTGLADLALALTGSPAAGMREKTFLVTDELLLIPIRNGMEKAQVSLWGLLGRAESSWAKKRPVGASRGR